MAGQTVFVVAGFVLAGIAYTLVIYVVLRLARRDEPKFQGRLQHKRPGKTIGASPLPGPEPLPFIGNLHHLKSPLHIALRRMSEQFGPIFQIHFGSRRWVVLKDARVAQDLLVNRESTYPSRSVIGYFADACPGESPHTGDVVIHDRRYRAARGFLEHALTINAVEKRYTPAIRSGAQKFASCLHSAFAKPVDPTDDLRRCVMAAYLRIAYGDVTPNLVDRLDEIVDSCWPATRRHPLDAGSWLRCLPLIERALDAKTTYSRKQFEKLSYELVDDAMKRGADNCVAAKVLTSCGNKRGNDKDELDGLNGRELTNLSVAMLLDTAAATTAQLRWILAMLAYMPHVQRQILLELHQVVGAGRLPEARHLHNLHYLRACVKECARMRPVSFTLPHIAVRDDVYNGHLLPAGSVVLVNSNSIHYDPELFSSPKRFMPERYLNEDSTFRKSNGEREPWSPWMGSSPAATLHDLAERTLITFVASVLVLFNVEHEIDAVTGEPLEIDMEGEQRGLELAVPRYRLRFVQRRGIDADQVLKQTL